MLADEDDRGGRVRGSGKRHPKSRSRGRRGTPAEVVLRLLILKHIRNWSYEVLEREVRANLVYRDFTRVGAGKMPDAKTMGRWGVALGPEVIKQIHERMVKMAQSQRRWRQAAECAWTPRWWRPTSTIRPIQACWATACGC